MSLKTGSIKEILLTKENLLEKSLLSSLSKSTEILTSKQGWEHGINAILKDLGNTTKVSRVWIFQIIELNSEYITQDYAFEWAAAPKYVQLGMPVFKEFKNKIGTEEYRELIESRTKGEWQKTITSTLPDSWLKNNQVKQNIKSMLTIPIIVEEKLWGVLGFDDCEREYDWSDTEIALLQIASFFISSAVLQNRLSSKEKQLNILQKIVSSGSWEYDIRNKHLLTYSEIFSSNDKFLENKHFSLVDFFKFVHKDDRKNLLETIIEFFSGDKEIFTYDLRIENTKGKYQWIEIIGALERDSDRNPLKLSGIVIKVDSRKEIEIKLKKEAETDHLTGILNRRIFWEKLDYQIKKSKNRNNIFSLLIFDIDHFKKVNDTWGHSAGDEVLKHFTLLCLKELREGDSFSRVGGEEFALILQNASEKIALKVGERIRKSVEQHPCRTEGFEISITVSAGCTSYTDSKINSKTLYKITDAALYKAKKSGRNRITCHSEE